MSAPILLQGKTEADTNRIFCIYAQELHYTSEMGSSKFQSQSTFTKSPDEQMNTAYNFWTLGSLHHYL